MNEQMNRHALGLSCFASRGFNLQFCSNASSLQPVPYPAIHFLANLQSVSFLKSDIPYPRRFLMLLPMSLSAGKVSSGFRGPAEGYPLHSFDPLLSSSASSAAHSRYNAETDPHRDEEPNSCRRAGSTASVSLCLVHPLKHTHTHTHTHLSPLSLSSNSRTNHSDSGHASSQLVQSSSAARHLPSTQLLCISSPQPLLVITAQYLHLSCCFSLVFMSCWGCISHSSPLELMSVCAFVLIL